MNLQKGDKVKIVGNIHGHSFEIGETVTIITCCNDRKTQQEESYYRAMGTKTHEWWFVFDSEIVMVDTWKAKCRIILQTMNYR